MFKDILKLQPRQGIKINLWPSKRIDEAVKMNSNFYVQLVKVFPMKPSKNDWEEFLKNL
jgi:hypothetical protein